VNKLLEYLPRGNTLNEKAWRRRHKFLQWILFLHLPSLYLFGVTLGNGKLTTAAVLIAPLLCLLLGRLVHNRRLASLFITAGLVYCSAALVGLSHGSIEAHFHFFIMIGFIALYQDWVPFLWNIVFTVLSHGLGSLLGQNLIFNHPAGQTSPWVWSAIHGVAVLAACIGVVVFWRTTEDEQQKALNLTRQLSQAEINRRRFTSDLLVNLARRNQSMLYRQLDIINQLEEQERDPDALAELFRLDHLATRIRRNAESLLVLSGEEPARVWGQPVPLLDVVRAAIAETEDLNRLIFTVDERLAVLGRSVTDLTHLLAELMENAVRFSPPESSVTVRTRPYLQAPGAHVLTVEDWGVGMGSADLAAANDLLAHPREVDLSVSKQLGLHVVARLGRRHGIQVSLMPTPGCGTTAAVVLPAELFAESSAKPTAAPTRYHAMPDIHAVRVNHPGAIPAVVPMTDATSVPLAMRPPAATSPQPPPWPSTNGSGDDTHLAGWWESVPQDAEVTEWEPTAEAPAPPPAASIGTDTAAAAPQPQLRNRVPQTHLTPELRRPSQPLGAGAPSGTSSSDTTWASDALSRYQAARQAAKTLAEGVGPADQSTGTGPWA
jgi:signal transduction histidine kinase